MSNFVLVNEGELIDIDKFERIEKSANETNGVYRIYFYYKCSNDISSDNYYVDYNNKEDLENWFIHIMQCMKVDQNVLMFSPEYPM